MTMAQYDALIEISNNGEKFKACDLNIRPQTVSAIANRGWIEVSNGYASVTQAGWNAAA